MKLMEDWREIGKGVNEINRERDRKSELSILHLNPAGCSSPTTNLHVKLALWLLFLSEGQLSLFLLV